MMEGSRWQSEDTRAGVHVFWQSLSANGSGSTAETTTQPSFHAAASSQATSYN